MNRCGSQQLFMQNKLWCKLVRHLLSCHLYFGEVPRLTLKWFHLIILNLICRIHKSFSNLCLQLCKILIIFCIFLFITIKLERLAVLLGSDSKYLKLSWLLLMTFFVAFLFQVLVFRAWVLRINHFVEEICWVSFWVLILGFILLFVFRVRAANFLESLLDHFLLL